MRLFSRATLWSSLFACAVAFTSCSPKQTLNPPERSGASNTPAPASSPVAVATPQVTPQVLQQGKTLLMHYMPWYETPAGRGRWGCHWTGHEKQHHPDRLGENGLPDIWSNYHPLIGLYDSADPDLLECHLLQMKLAGVNGVIVDWYGITNTADYPPIHQATRAMFDAAGRFGMKFAVCFEDRSLGLMLEQGELKPEQVESQLQQNLQWMQANWFSHPQYFRLNGKPLFLTFGPMYVKDAGIWSAALDSVKDRPAFFALHHLWRGAKADGGFTWVHSDPWEGSPTPEQIQTRLAETFSYSSGDPQKVIVSAYPSYNDVYPQHLEYLDARGGATMKETLKAGMAGKWTVIQLVTWNDYGEGTIIEPTHETGYTSLEAIQEARTAELGSTFCYKPDDLRLPARLYALRKKKGIAPAELDQISILLNAGTCDEARRKLASYE